MELILSTGEVFLSFQAIWLVLQTEYVSDIPAIWAYLWGKSYTYQFNNESITNFRKYSDKCFSCDVYYDLYVDYKTGNTTYKTSLIYICKTEWYMDAC